MKFVRRTPNRRRHVVEDVVEGDEAMKADLKDVKRLLQEIQTAGKEVEGEDVENGTGEVTQRKKIRVASTDRDGKLLCWGFLTHMGCTSTSCQRAHEQLRGPFEALDAAVQMQLLRRGGLKRMKMETKEKVTERIKAIRTAHNADKAAKIKDGVRKAGNGEDGKSPREELDGRAGSRAQRVRFEVPAELTQVDYTKAEAEMQELVKGPDTSWVEEVPHQQKPHGGRAGDSAPRERRSWLRRLWNLRMDRC